ncbi:MAG: ArnT family glycosyltransferase, partial [Acidimicrobiia bacterium]
MPTPEVARVAMTEPSPARLRWWPDAVLLAFAALLVRVPAFFAPTNLGYDDGGYGLAAIAMREGYEPFRDIFSSQGPLFLPLVHFADLIGFQRLDSPRLLAVAAGIVTTVAVYAAGSQVLDRGRALLAGALTATSGVLLWTTGPITGDGPATAFATSAVAVALAYRRTPTRGRAVTVGLLVGAAVAVKSLLVGPAILIAWLLVLQRRRTPDAVLVPGLAAALLVALSIPWGVANVVHDNIQYHLDKTGERKPGANAVKLVTTFFRRDLPMLTIGGVGIVAALVAWSHRRSGGRHAEHPEGPGPDGGSGSMARLLGGSRVVWWWTGLVVIVLLVQDPMFRNHLAALVAPLALAVATIRPSWPLVGVAWAVTLPFQVVELQ